MMLVSVIHATKVQCVTPTLSMAVPFALVQLALLVAPATRTWMSVLLVPTPVSILGNVSTQRVPSNVNVAVDMQGLGVK